MRATISGDIIASTSLTDKGRETLAKGFRRLIRVLKKEHGVYARVIKGDYIECYLENPEEALRIVLIIKTFIKSLSINTRSGVIGVRHFKIHGIRLAMGLGSITRFDARRGIIDGEAIYMSGRLINLNTKVYKERKIIKSTLFIDSSQKQITEESEPLLALLDVIIARCTARQCEVLYHRLSGKSEAEVAKILKVSQPTINQHSTAAGWNAIEKTVNRFSTIIKNLKS
ncbi:fumarate hydratase [Natronoflexus pectinivorans]|nr:fumarate hydratase [Natronoflexus pectinivorans]